MVNMDELFLISHKYLFRIIYPMATNRNLGSAVHPSGRLSAYLFVQHQYEPQ